MRKKNVNQRENTSLIYKLINVFSLSALIISISLMGVFFIGHNANAAACPDDDVVPIETYLDYVDIGSTTSETGHSLLGWTDEWIKPGWGGNYGGGSGDESFRLLMGERGNGCGGGYEDADLTFNTGDNYADQITFEHLDGSVDDSFDVYINNLKVGHYIGGENSGENWIVSTYKFSPITGAVAVKFIATEPDNEWCALWGQVAFSWVGLKGYACEESCDYYVDGYKYYGESDEVLSGWEIQLVDLDGDVIMATTTTNENGYYNFNGLCAGNYEIHEVLQPGWTQIYPVDHSYHSVDLPGEEGDYYDFSNYATGTLTICKQNDLNGNGILEEGEPVIPGWNFYMNDQTYSDKDACVVLEDMSYDTYNVTEETRENWIPTGMSENGYLEDDGSITVTVGGAMNYPIIYFLNYYDEPVDEPECGDGTCNGDETCSTCSDDCGSCGGGGGGHLWTELTIMNERAGEVSGDSMTITWLTNKPATSRVIYDTVSHPDISGESAPNYGYVWSTVLDTTKVTGHSVTITGLDPNTNYYFRPLSSASPEIYGTEIEYITGEAGSGVVVLGEEGSPELVIEKSVDREDVNPGDTDIRFFLNFKNQGNLTAFNVIITDTLPEGLTYADQEGNTKEWVIGDMLPGETREVSYLVNASDSIEAGNYPNIAVIAADNHGSVQDTVILTAGDVVVLAESGFSGSEFLALIMAVIGLFGASRGLKFGAENV